MTTLRIALFTAAVAFFALGSDCPPQRVIDEGFHVAPDGTVLHPGALPFWVEGDETVPSGVVEDAALWWNAALGCDALIAAEAGEPAQVTVGVGMVPASTLDIDSGGEPLGLAVLDYAEDGAILSCAVTISSDIAYDEATVAQVARHEIGCHCAGALADDPGPPETVDLRSICSSPLDPLGTLTAADRARLEPFCP